MSVGNGSEHELTPLLDAAREGDTDALGRLLEAYRNYLNLLARLEVGRRLQAKVDASDLVQETFLQAYRAFPDFRGVTEAEVTKWLRQILASRLSKAIRRYHGTQRRNVQLERELHQELGRSSQVLDRILSLSQTSPSQRAARREEAVLLADAIERLPEDYRDVLVLRHLRGMTFPQVAQTMNRSLNSVEKLWARGLAKLREQMGGSP
jgi:RNA polymerase sigma-70 factor (ECF subfamily)